MSIRKRLMVMALMGTTALTPAPARADPISAFIAGFVNFISTGVPIAAGIGGAFAAGSATAAFFGSAIGSIVLSVGLSLVSSALAPKPQSVDPGDRMVNYAQPISYMETAYGEVRNGGVLGMTVMGRDVLTYDVPRPGRHYAVILASHSINGVLEHYLDDTLCEFNEDDIAITEPFGNGTKASSIASVRTYNGQPGQVADPAFVASIPEWTEAHDMAGLAYAAIFARKPSSDRFQVIYTNGDIWQYAPLIQGHDRIYDPRTESLGYTNNAALIIAHEIVHRLGGTVDWDAVAVEADVCDELVTTASGGTQRRWTINTLIADDQEWEEIRTTLMAACDGIMFENPDGSVGFHVGRWIEPTVTLTDADFLSINITEGHEIGTATQFVAQYVEPANLYRRTPTGPYVADPEGRRITREVVIAAVDNYDQAVRLMARTAAIDRARYRVAGTLKMSGRQLQGQRFVRIEHADTGFSSVIEVGKLVLAEDRVSYRFEGVSTSAADFAFDALTQTPERPVYEDLSPDDAIDNVDGLAGTPAGTGAILWQWDQQDQSLTQEIRLRSVDGGQPDWQIFGAGAGQRTFLATGLVSGSSVEAQVRNRTSSGRLSEWKPDTPVAVTVSGLVPGELTLDTVTAAPGGLAIVGESGANTVAIEVLAAATDDSGSAGVVGYAGVTPLADFSAFIGDAAAVNAVVNGDFASSSGWTTPGGWSIGSGVATHVANGANNTMSRSATLEAGEVYRWTASMPSHSGGTALVRLFGSTTVSAAAFGGAGVHQGTITAPASPTSLGILAGTTCNATFDDFFVVKDTTASLDQGGQYFWIRAVSPDGTRGPLSASFFRTIP